MVQQYLVEDLDRRALDSIAISAGEHAITALAEYGYMEVVRDRRIFGRWTSAGLALLDWNYPAAEQAFKVFPKPPIIPAPPLPDPAAGFR